MSSYTVTPTISPSTVVAAVSIGAATLGQMAEVFGVPRSDPMLTACLARAAHDRWVTRVAGTIDAYTVLPHVEMPPVAPVEG